MEGIDATILFAAALLSPLVFLSLVAGYALRRSASLASFFASAEFMSKANVFGAFGMLLAFVATDLILIIGAFTSGNGALVLGAGQLNPAGIVSLRPDLLACPLVALLARQKANLKGNVKEQWAALLLNLIIVTVVCFKALKQIQT